MTPEPGSILNSTVTPTAPMSQEESLTMIAFSLAEISLDIKKIQQTVAYIHNAMIRSGHL